MNKMYTLFYVFLVSLVACESEEIAENGRTVTSEGEEVVPFQYPWVLPTVLEEAVEAAEWWNEKAYPRELFVFTDDSIEDWELGTVALSEEEPVVEGRIGEFRCRIDGAAYTACKATVHPNITNPTTRVDIWKHELGHILGLDDDPFTIWNLSIMSYKLIERAPVTTQDLVLVVSDYDRRE